VARVNVDSQALTDARFAVLASFMGVSDPDFALGKMVRLWMQCIERETYVVTKPVIVALFGGANDAPDWLLNAELAEQVDGGLRIKGTRGRIEYLSMKRATARENGRLGGRPVAATRKTHVGSTPVIAKTPPAPAPAPAPISTRFARATRTPSKHFVVPKVEEVDSYCREIGSKVDAQRFMDYYTANGWKVGKNAMKDWKAAVRNWHKNEQERGPHSHRNGKPTLAERQGPALIEFINEGMQHDS
jgi:hypothetical protein